MRWASIVFLDAPGQPAIAAELAETGADRARGLMFRQHLRSYRGMLFCWPDERVRSLWMRNTRLELDMLFLAQSGAIVGILERVPPLNDAVRSIPVPAACVLEVGGGWARAHHVFPGQRVAIVPLPTAP